MARESELHVMILLILLPKLSFYVPVIPQASMQIGNFRAQMWIDKTQLKQLDTSEKGVLF